MFVIHLFRLGLSARFVFGQCVPRAALLYGIVILSMPPAIEMASAAKRLDRQKYLELRPLAAIDVQTLVKPKPEYSTRNGTMRYQTEQEDPLALYTRTHDGEWLIPVEVDREDPWLRLLVLEPSGPTIVDVAVEINGQPYRSAREQWIDKLLKEAKAAFLARTGVTTVEASGNIDTTSPAIQESDATESQKTTTDSTAKATESAETEQANPEVPMVSAQSRRTKTLSQRLINILAIDQTSEGSNGPADRERVRWLLAEWTGGPGLLTLGPAFGWQRAGVAPLWQALDRNGNDSLGGEEIAQATKTLQQADINRDDTVDLSELQRLRKDRSTYQRTNSHSLIVVIDEQTDWRTLKKHLKHAYATTGEVTSAITDKETLAMTLKTRIASGDRALNTIDLKKLLSLPPDLVYRVSFGNQQAKAELLMVGDVAENRWQFAMATEQVITVEKQVVYIELSAAQGKIDIENTVGDMQQTQIAVGAVADGYPLLRMLDHDNNQQLTLRERREVEDFLLSLDHNQDGQVDRSEVPTAVRLAVTLGPQVHQHLSKATAATQKRDGLAATEAPAWFLAADRNQDGDLSRREFKGNPSQFAKLDRDNDGLISQKEIQAMTTGGE